MTSENESVDFPAAIEAIRSDIGVLSEAFGVPTRKGRTFKRLTLQPQTNSRLMAQAQQSRDTPGQVTTVRGNGLAMEYHTAKVDRRFVSGHLGIDSNSVGSIFGKTLSAVVYGHGRTAQALVATQSESIGPSPSATAMAVAAKDVAPVPRASRRKLQQPNDGLHPPCHQLLPLPSLRKFDSEQPTLAFKAVARPKLLIVDSNMIHLAACKAIFDKHFELVHAVSMAEQALELLEHLHFDLALIAADLPGYMSGVDLSDTIRRIEASGRSRMVIVGMLTKVEAADQGVVDACFIGGMDRFVLKPAILVATLLKTLLTGGSSVDVFRRLTLETQWFSRRDQVKDILVGSTDRAANAQLFAESQGTEETMQNAIAADIEDREVQEAVVDLHKRQRQEEYTTVLAATFHLRERIEQLEHEANGLRAQLEFRRAADEAKRQSLLGVESRLNSLEKSLHEKSLLAAAQTELADRYREDLRTMIRDGSANAQKVAQAMEHAKKMGLCAEASERMAMGAQDSVAWRAWYNYYGDERLRSALHDYVPKKAKDVTASYYRDHLLHLLSAMKKQRLQVAKSVDIACATMRKFSTSKEASSPQSVANVVESQTAAMQECVAEDLSTLQDHVDAAVANIMVRELEFWRMLENDDPRLREELALLRAALVSWRSENHPVEVASQTEDAFEAFLGPGGGFLSAERLLQAEQSAQLAVLTRYLPFFTDERYLSPAAKMKVFEEMFDAMFAVESKDRLRVFEATKEVQTEVWKIAKRISDPERTVKLMAPLSRLNQQSFNAVVATLQNISENLDLLFTLAQRSAPQKSAIEQPPVERKAPVGARLSLDGAKKAMLIPTMKREAPTLPPMHRTNSTASQQRSNSTTAHPAPSAPSESPSTASEVVSPGIHVASSNTTFDQNSQFSRSVTPSVEKKTSDLIAPVAVDEARSSPAVELAPVKPMPPPRRVEPPTVKPQKSAQQRISVTPKPAKPACSPTPPPLALPATKCVTPIDADSTPRNSLSHTAVCLPPFAPTPVESPEDTAIPVTMATSLFEPDEPDLVLPPMTTTLHESTNSLPTIGNPVSVSKSPFSSPPVEPAPVLVPAANVDISSAPLAPKVSFKRSPPQPEAPPPPAQHPRAKTPPLATPPQVSERPKLQSRNNSIRNNSPPVEKKKSVVSAPTPAPPDATLKLVEIAFAEKTEPGNMRHGNSLSHHNSISGKESVAKQRQSMANLEQLLGAGPTANVSMTSVDGRLPSRQQHVATPSSASVFAQDAPPPLPAGADSSAAMFESLVQRRRSEKVSGPSQSAEGTKKSASESTSLRSTSFTASIREKRQNVKTALSDDLESGNGYTDIQKGLSSVRPHAEPEPQQTPPALQQGLGSTTALPRQSLSRGVPLSIQTRGSEPVISPGRHTAKDVDAAMAQTIVAEPNLTANDLTVSGEGVAGLGELPSAQLPFSGGTEPSIEEKINRSPLEPVVGVQFNKNTEHGSEKALQPANQVESRVAEPSKMTAGQTEGRPPTHTRSPPRVAPRAGEGGREGDGTESLKRQNLNAFPLAPVASVPFAVRASVLPMGMHIGSSLPGAVSPPAMQMPLPLSPALPRLTSEDFPVPPFPWPKPRSSRLLPSSEGSRASHK